MTLEMLREGLEARSFKAALKLHFFELKCILFMLAILTVLFGSAWAFLFAPFIVALVIGSEFMIVYKPEWTLSRLVDKILSPFQNLARGWLRISFGIPSSLVAVALFCAVVFYTNLIVLEPQSAVVISYSRNFDGTVVTVATLIDFEEQKTYMQAIDAEELNHLTQQISPKAISFATLEALTSQDKTEIQIPADIDKEKSFLLRKTDTSYPELAELRKHPTEGPLATLVLASKESQDSVNWNKLLKALNKQRDVYRFDYQVAIVPHEDRIL